MEHIQTAMLKSGAGLRQPWPPGSAPVPQDRKSLWEAIPAAKIHPLHLEANRVAHLQPAASAAFDILRTRCLQLLRQNNWTTVAITSPNRDAGKSTVALNLAFSLALRDDCHTILLDLDLRRPSLGELLGLRSTLALEDAFGGLHTLDQMLQCVRPNLAVAANGRPVQLAAELLQSPVMTKAIRDLKQRFNPDVLICDLPPMLASDDVAAFLPNVDCVILVVEAEADTLGQVDACERELAAQTNVLGVVLNKCRQQNDLTASARGD